MNNIIKIEKKSKSINIFTGIGMILIIIALVLSIYLLLTSISINRKLNHILQDIHELLPETSYATWDDRTNKNMPIVQIDGINFIGLIEIPSYSVELPLYAEYDKLQIYKNPYRYTGNVYDGTLIIGSNYDNQNMSFVNQIDINDNIIITDMEGYQYIYYVDVIETNKNISTEILKSSNHDLIIFAKKSYSFEYVILRCSLQN